MAEMKSEDIRAMSPDQMEDAVLNLKKERFNLRFQRATGQLENTARIREARRDIARIKTIAGQKRAAKTSSKTDDWRAKTPDELGTELTKLKKEAFNLRFQRANGQLENTGRVRTVRKEIARLQTVLSEQRRKAG